MNRRHAGLALGSFPGVAVLKAAMITPRVRITIAREASPR